jgi:hypothetical protein
VEEITNRKLVKAAYMPLVYGKSVIALANDIDKVFFPNKVSRKESYTIAKIFFDFGNEIFSNQKQFMALCYNIAYLSATLDRAVYIQNNLLSIVQDYKLSNKNVAPVFDPKFNKIRRITLTVHTEKTFKSGTRHYC